MKFCFFYFLCLFIIYFLSKNLISTRLITMLIDLCCCLCLSFCFFFFLIRLGRIGPRIRPKRGWTGPTETWRAEFGAKKNTLLLNRPDSGNRGGPAGRVWVSKYLTWTRPIVILSSLPPPPPKQRFLLSLWSRLTSLHCNYPIISTQKTIELLLKKKSFIACILCVQWF